MALVFYGARTVRKLVGRVADYCPICRDLKTFELNHIGIAAHIYGLALGDGDTISYEAECEACKIVIATHVRRYSSVSTDPEESQEHILNACTPNRPEKLNQQLEQAERLRAGALTPDERKAAMADTFEFLNDYAKQRRTQASIDIKGKDGCISSLMVFVLAYLAWYGWNESFPQSALIGRNALALFVGIFVIGLSYTFWMIATDTKRYVRTELQPMLARALRPMNPTRIELQSLLERFQKRKFTLARNLSLADIEEALAAQT